MEKASSPQSGQAQPSVDRRPNYAELVNLLQECKLGLYNGFEPDNQGALYKRVDATLVRTRLANAEDDMTPPEQLASKLIDVWCASKGQITWAKAIAITAIVTHMSEAERDRLLALGEKEPGHG